MFAAPAPATDGVQDARTLWQRQHDGLVNALEATQRCADLPTHNGVSATIVLTMTTEQYVTGAGLATTGHGHPVPASKALGWSRGDTEILVVALNSLRAVTHYSHRHRIFTETQRRVMGLRDGGCTFPGCPAPPSRCQTDHIHRWEHGGTTTVTNGQLLCPYHHQHHQRLGWTPAMINELPHWIPPDNPRPHPDTPTQHPTRHPTRRLTTSGFRVIMGGPAVSYCCAMSEPTRPGLPAFGGEPPYGPGTPPPPVSAYGPPPGGAGGSSGGAVVAAVLALVLVAATIVSALVAHNSSESRTAVAGPGPGGASSLSINGASSSGNAPVPTPSTTSVYSPTAAPTPTHQPLDSEAINRTFEVYMNALLDHNMYSLRSATCPKLRHTLKGFALHGKYLRRWAGLPYQIYNALDYVRLSARVYFASPYSGSAVYDWYVERTSSGHYYVCGFLS